MLKAARLSTVKFITGLLVGQTYIDFDDHADLTKLPPVDLVGINGFAIHDQDRVHEIIFNVAISTYLDTSLFRMTDIADTFYRAMNTQKQFPIYDPTSGAQIGVATMLPGTSVAPVARSLARSVMNVTGSAKIVVNADWSGL